MRIQTLTATLTMIVFSWMPSSHTPSIAAQESDVTGNSLKVKADPNFVPINSSGQEEALLEMGEAFAMQIALELDIRMPDAVSGRLLSDPQTGRSLFVFKVVDEYGEVTALLFDRRGNLLSTDPTSWMDAIDVEQSPIHPELKAAMETANKDASLQVMLWCRTPEILPARPRLEVRDVKAVADQKPANGRLRLVEVPAELPPLSADLQELAMSGTDSVAQRLLEMNIEFQVTEDAPVIYASLTPAELESIATHPEILECYLETNNVPSMATSRQVMRANTVNSRGITGNGVRVGVIEVGGRINFANPWLTGTQRLDNTCFNNHAAMVAGVIASRHGTHRGIAPDAQLFVGGSCGGFDSQLQSAMTAATTWGVRVINNSWNSTDSSRIPNGMARFVDRLVGLNYRVVVQSAGNSGNAAGNVANPATFYNGISVGALDDRGTVSTWDDRMASFSSYLNPLSSYSDRVKPEVVAPGTNITSLTNSSDWLGTGSGTSYAAPAVAGTAALILQRSPSLRDWPETIKAIVMATALQNIEGDARLSTYDGVGSVQADRADDVTRGINGGWNGQPYTATTNANFDVRQVYLTAGRRTRVVLAWNQDTNYSQYSSRPAVDLDLQILRPNGTIHVGSSSWDNTYEIVDFTPTVSGWHTIRVKRLRTSGAINGIGVAWYQP